MNSQPGSQGDSIAMLHAIMRLFMGKAMVPNGSHELDVTEITNFGRLLISTSEQVQVEVIPFA